MPAARKQRYPKLAALAAPWTSLEWWATCKGCGHESRVPDACLHGAMARLGGGVAAKDARPRLYCSRCGSRDFRTDVVPGHGGQAMLPLTGTEPPPAPIVTRRPDGHPVVAVKRPGGRKPRLLTVRRDQAAVQ